MFSSETEFVRWLQRTVHGRARGLRLGIGDDAALVEVRRGCELILTTDMSIENVHFTRRLHPPHSVGHRALARSLSDIAAMGGTPRYALVSLAISRQTTRIWIRDFYQAMLKLARRFGVALAGGDTAFVRGGTMIDVMVAGEIPRGQALRRSGARPGDHIFVSGRLGMSALGLRLLKMTAQGLQPRRVTPRRSTEKTTVSRAVQAHLFPEPQCFLGRFLADHRLASAMMDISDGLSTDLARLCAANDAGARLFAESIPAPNVSDRVQSLELALHGGEDYQLLFTVPPSKLSRIPSRLRHLPLHQIGKIEGTKGLRLVGSDSKVHPLHPAGWDYFRKSK